MLQKEMMNRELPEVLIKKWKMDSFPKDTFATVGHYTLGCYTTYISNQELLRRISGITNRELPVESLLVWEDLYPVIDRIYNGFYTQMNRRFGSVLIDKEQQLCCLLCAEFSTKEISVVTQQSIPTIYQRKTNIRKKLGMGEKEDIVGFILEK